MNPQQYYQRIAQQIPNKGLAQFFFIQSMYETGRLSSALFLNNNNGFGMTFVNQKLAEGFTESTSPIDGIKRKWAKYKNIDYSIQDRLRLAKVKKYENETQFDNIYNKVIESGYLGYTPNPKEVEGYRNGLQALRREYLHIFENSNNENKREISEIQINPTQVIIGILILIVIYEIRIRK